MIGIYKITNLINGKSYIGQSIHIERRWGEHCQPSAKSLIGKAIQKYGKEKFSFQVLEECTPDLLDEREEYYIHLYNSVIPNGYNIMDWVEGNAVYFTMDKEILTELFSDIQNSSLTFDEIGEKYDLSRRTIIRINQGDTHFSTEYQYPLRSKKSDSKNKNCLICGVPITKGSNYCQSCFSKSQRKAERPEREELKQLIRNFPFTTLGKRYGVSDNAVRKWCIQYGLPHKSSEIKKISETEWGEI